jgi:hypothetical protein
VGRSPWNILASAPSNVSSIAILFS